MAPPPTVPTKAAVLLTRWLVTDKSGRLSFNNSVPVSFLTEIDPVREVARNPASTSGVTKKVNTLGRFWARGSTNCEEG